MVNIVVQKEWYSRAQCWENPKTLYIFGDNTHQLGCGGQAVIRGLRNTHGIPTKRLPGMDDDSFFSDQIVQYLKVEMAITDLLRAILSGEFDTVVFPADGLGTGLSEMPKRSPMLYEYMNMRLKDCFGVRFEGVEYHGPGMATSPVSEYAWWNNVSNS